MFQLTIRMAFAKNAMLGGSHVRVIRKKKGLKAALWT